MMKQLEPSVHRPHSCHCTVETNTILKQLYSKQAIYIFSVGTVISVVSLDLYVWTIVCPLCAIEKIECAEYLTLFYRQDISSSECLGDSTKIIHQTNWRSRLKALLFKQAMSTFTADQIDHWFHLDRFNKICMSIKIIRTYSLRFCLDNYIYFWEVLVFLTQFQLCLKWLHVSLENGVKLAITFLCEHLNSSWLHAAR